ncbi:Lactation elevated protein 1 [Hordeum vulgare]|nr:Lactation elevated protein 1 [Hordeum vulgare]
MEAFQPADLVNVEVAHAQAHTSDLVASHVAPAPSVANAPTRKWQGNIVVQDDIPIGPHGREGAPGAAAAARSARPSAGKMNKVLGVKRKKVPTKKPPATPPPRRDVRRWCLPTALLPWQARVDIDQAPLGGFDYNELEGGIDDHGGEDEVEEIDEWTYQQSQGKKREIKELHDLERSNVDQGLEFGVYGSLHGNFFSQQRYKDMDASTCRFFKLEHRWEFLKNCDKWALIDRESPPKRGSLTDMDEDEADDGPRNLNKPVDDKKTKDKIKRQCEATTLWDKIDSMLQSNEVLLAKSLDAKIEMAEKKAREKQERWKLLKKVEERKARAAENKTMANLLAEENKIMTLNCNDMDDINKEWHDMTMREILKRRMLVCYGGDGLSSGIGTDDFDAGVGTSVEVGTSAGDGFGGGDEVDGAD